MNTFPMPSDPGFSQSQRCQVGLERLHGSTVFGRLAVDWFLERYSHSPQNDWIRSRVGIADSGSVGCYLICDVRLAGDGTKHRQPIRQISSRAWPGRLGSGGHDPRTS